MALYYRSLTSLKPTSAPLPSGEAGSRNAERILSCELLQEPPRITLRPQPGLIQASGPIGAWV